MDYRRFVATRTAACDAFEARLRTARERPRDLDYLELERLAIEYRQMLHDHSLARARFPGTALARRLHRLVLEGTHWLQQEPATDRASPGRFLRTTFPRAFRHALPSIGLLTALFLLATLFGLCLTAVEPGVASLFLSPQALDNLREGELWTESVFSVAPGSVVSSRIATNNVSVALSGWAGGAAGGVIGLFIVFLNGLMLGSLIAATMHYSMATPLLEFIAAHGPLELTLILVTTAAGLDVGRALIVASDRPRGVLLQEAGGHAIALLLGCIPWFFLCALVEGFISPVPQLTPGSKVTVGLLLISSFLAIAGRTPREDPR